MTDRVVVLAQCRYGSFQFFEDDWPIGDALATYGEWAQAEIDLLLTFLEPGGVALDVGANIGTHTVALARRAGKTGSIFAFEPQKAVFDLLASNLQRNGLNNVVVQQQAVSDQPGRLFVPSPETSAESNSGALSLVNGNTVGEEVEVIAIDDLDLGACDLVKVDVEGMESAVLRGMSRTIRNLRPILLVECNTIESGISTLRVRDWAGYATFFARTSYFNPNNFLGSQVNTLGYAQETHLLFVPVERQHLVPESTSLVTLIPIASVEDLAVALVETPRGGDKTPFDRQSARSLAESSPDRLVTVATDDQSDVRFRLAASERALELAVVERDSTRRQLDDAHLERERIFRSASWRITRPLRVAKRLLGQLRGSR